MSPFVLANYSQFDKHNCIAFHRVNCDEPTPSLLDMFKCLSSISSKFAVVIAKAIGYSFSCKSQTKRSHGWMSVDRILQNVTFSKIYP